MMRATADERAALRQRFRQEWEDGARCGFSRVYPGKREKGGYPAGFHNWPLDRRNSWFSGYYVGFCDRLRVAQEDGSDGA
jgi:hypothetical protein